MTGLRVAGLFAAAALGVNAGIKVGDREHRLVQEPERLCRDPGQGARAGVSRSGSLR